MSLIPSTRPMSPTIIRHPPLFHHSFPPHANSYKRFAPLLTVPGLPTSFPYNTYCRFCLIGRAAHPNRLSIVLPAQSEPFALQVLASDLSTLMVVAYTRIKATFPQHWTLLTLTLRPSPLDTSDARLFCSPDSRTHYSAHLSTLDNRYIRIQDASRTLR